MVFQNIDFHNVAELQPCEKGYGMLRVPDRVRLQLSEPARERASRFASGVELRFKIKSETATVILRADPNEEAQTACIYYGAFQGGWKTSTKTIGLEETRITIPKPEHLDTLQKITEEQQLGFQPDVVRLLLPYGTCYFVGVEGDVEPPKPADLPRKTYLAYGSSITHGSLALVTPATYTFRLARRLKCDYCNLGFAGSAHMEKGMAEYLVSRKDWDFATVEMGINMMGDEFPVALFEERVRDFVAVLARDPRPVFATDMFGFVTGNTQKADQYRQIVRRYASEKLIFTDGLSLLGNPAHLSQDLTHPAWEGMEEIAANWYPVIRQHI